MASSPPLAKGEEGKGRGRGLGLVLPDQQRLVVDGLGRLVGEGTRWKKHPSF